MSALGEKRTEGHPIRLATVLLICYSAPLGRLEEEERMNDQAKDLASAAARLAALTEMVIDQIRKLAELHEQGILTDEDFSAKKTELLSRV